MKFALITYINNCKCVLLIKLFASKPDLRKLVVKDCCLCEFSYSFCNYQNLDFNQYLGSFNIYLVAILRDLIYSRNLYKIFCNEEQSSLHICNITEVLLQYEDLGFFSCVYNVEPMFYTTVFGKRISHFKILFKCLT